MENAPLVESLPWKAKQKEQEERRKASISIPHNEASVVCSGQDLADGRVAFKVENAGHAKVSFLFVPRNLEQFQGFGAPLTGLHNALIRIWL